MTSINENVNALLMAHCAATGINTPLTFASERWLLAAHCEGVTPEDVRLSVQWRRQKNKGQEARYQKPISLSRMFSSEEAIACVVEESAEMKARQRKVVVPQGRADVLRATGRNDETVDGKPAKDNIVSMADNKLIQDLRRAAS